MRLCLLSLVFVRSFVGTFVGTFWVTCMRAFDFVSSLLK